MVTVSGRVTSKYDNAPVSGAIVSIGGYSTTSGPDGDFYIAVPPISTTITVSHGSFEPYSSRIDTSAATYVDIALNPKFTFL